MEEKKHVDLEFTMQVGSVGSVLQTIDCTWLLCGSPVHNKLAYPGIHL